MLLIIDIGNSSIKMAIFDGDRICKFLSLDSDKDAGADYYAEKLSREFCNDNIAECAIISVVDGFDKIMKYASDKTFGIDSVILDVKASNKIKINAENPKSLGMDRLANAYAVIECPLPAVVIDIGTAVTFDILSEHREFLGGAIMPGVNMSLNSLSACTSKLPKIAPKRSTAAIGKNTEECILSGVIRGTACAIDGLIEQCADEIGSFKTIVLTGGQAELVSQYMKHSFDSVDKELTLKGTEKLYRLFIKGE